jgi:1-deoxy-D-xylulose-5-phosphate reductoisomerase
MATPSPRMRPQTKAMVATRSVSVLGATGSIGASTVDLLRRGKDRFRVEALSANRSAIKLAQLARELGARFAAVADPDAYHELKDALAGSGIEAGGGPTGLIEAAERPSEVVVAAISGAIGLKPTLAAVARGATIALANKECLVCAGGMFMRAVAAANVKVLPVDSEHNAVFQAMTAGRREDIQRVILTASGGPFRTWSLEAMRAATPEQALQHPNWSMGTKITIDSATLMNKGLELIEAHHLFALNSAELDVLVHPQSIVHALVEFRDGSVVAQLGTPDMRIPIAHCLAWPERIEGPAARLDLAQVASLTFEQPDLSRFPALALARRALESGGAAPTVLNAANEVAVAGFAQRLLGFTQISELVAASLDAAERRGILSEPQYADEALAVDQIARSLAHDLLPEIAAKAS